MIKGTIATHEFYGKVVSIENKKQLKNNMDVISKRTGKRYKITGVTLVALASQFNDIRVTLSSQNSPLVKNISFDALKTFYWKVV